jgi:tetratricopeptide (TPR) repeat protein
MSGIRKLIREAHRRSLWQIVIFYIAASWVVLQVAEHVADQFGLPEWTYGAAVLLLLVGFPVVTATAFVQEGVGSGGKDPDESDSEDAEPAGQVSAGTAEAPAAAPQGSAAVGPASQHRLFTWRNAIVGGVAAFALLGLALGSFLFMRSAGIGSAGTLVAKGVLDKKARIIVADFDGPEDEPALPRTVTEAFRIDFGESPIVRVAEPSQVAAALERMQRAPDTPLDPELARELAIREGIAAVIAGEVGTAGSGYLLSARLLDAQDGAVLASHRETAKNADDLVPAIDRLSKRLRERIGESIVSLGESAPLERVTTASLEALEKYSEAEFAIGHEGNRTRAIALLEEAVALDSTFAMAHRKLGIALYILREERTRQVEQFKKAFDHRERLGELERYITEATYYTYGTGELEKAVTAYQNALAEDPESHTALNNLGLVYQALGDDERAWEYYQRALEVDSTFSNPYTNGIFTLINLDRADDARALHDRMTSNFPGNPGVSSDGWWLYGSTGDYETAAGHIENLRREYPGNAFLQAEAQSGLAAIASVEGHLQVAEQHLGQAIDIQRERELAAEFLNAALDLAWLQLAVAGDPTAAIRTLEAALEEQPIEGVQPYERPYASMASLYARAGQVATATRYLDLMETEVWPLANGDPDVQWLYFRARGDVATARGNHDQGIIEYRRIDSRYCPICRTSALGHGFDRAGVPDSAVVYMDAFATTPRGARIQADRLFLGGTYERLGQLYDELGNLDRAVEYYAKFTELWVDADEELQPRVQAAQTRLEEIVRERG